MASPFVEVETRGLGLHLGRRVELGDSGLGAG